MTYEIGTLIKKKREDTPYGVVLENQPPYWNGIPLEMHLEGCIVDTWGCGVVSGSCKLGDTIRWCAYRNIEEVDCE